MTRPIFEPERTYWYSVWDGYVCSGATVWNDGLCVEIEAPDFLSAVHSVRDLVRKEMAKRGYGPDDLCSVLVRGDEGGGVLGEAAFEVRIGEEVRHD